MIAFAHGPIYLVLPLAVLVALLALTAAPRGARRGTAAGVLGVGGIAAAGLLTSGDLGQTLAVSTTAFLLASGLPRLSESALVASRRTLAWLTIAASALLLSVVLDYLNANQPTPVLARPIGGLLVVGIAIVLGAFPLGFWLPSLAEESPGFAALLVGLLGLGAALLSAGMLTNSPWRVGNLAAEPLLVAFGLAGVFAALVAIGEKQPGRVFAYVISADAALQVGGLVATPPGPLGTAAPIVVFSFSAHALAGAAGLAVLAHDRPMLSGLFRRRPGLALALIVSASSLAGLPITAGFSSHLALNHVIAATTLLYPAFAALVSILSAIAVVRAFGRVFDRADESPATASAFDYLAGFAAAIILLAGFAPALPITLIR